MFGGIVTILIGLYLSQTFGFTVGDVHWPGGQGHPEVAPALIPTRRET